MNTELQKYCDLLVENRKVIHDVLPLESDMMCMAAAMLYTGRGARANADTLRETRAILKSHAGVFSDFRGMLETVTVCKMAMSGAPERWLTELEQVYGMVKKNRWMGSERKLLAAMTILECKGTAEAERYAEGTNALYRRMKETHPWLTSDEDLPFAALLAVSDLPADSLTEDMEQCYTLLKATFGDSDIRQSASHVLSLSPMDPPAKCALLSEVFDTLKAEKHRYSSGWAVPVLASLITPERAAGEIAALIMEADDYLKTFKGFGSWSMGSDCRRMYAAMLAGIVMGDGASPAESSLLNGSVAMLIQTQVCATAAIACAASASASAAAGH